MILCTAVCSGRIPCSAFNFIHNIITRFIPDRRSPFPDISPEIYCTVCTSCHILILIDRCSAIVNTAVEICIFWHMSCCKFPFTFRWQTICIILIIFCKPCTIFFCILIRYIIYRILFLS